MNDAFASFTAQRSGAARLLRSARRVVAKVSLSLDTPVAQEEHPQEELASFTAQRSGAVRLLRSA